MSKLQSEVSISPFFSLFFVFAVPLVLLASCMSVASNNAPEDTPISMQETSDPIAEPKTAEEFADPNSPDPFGSAPAEEEPEPEPVEEEPAPAPEPEPVEEEVDPNMGTCKEARAAGYGPYTKDDPEYEFYRDGDGDGEVCETESSD